MFAWLERERERERESSIAVTDHDEGAKGGENGVRRRARQLSWFGLGPGLLCLRFCA